MRLRLGLLQDSATIEKQVARAAADAQAKKHKSEIPTVKTEAQTKADESNAAREREKGSEKSKAVAAPKPKIRPLSEAKAIDSGATFVSEGFLLLVGISLILFENWRSKRKETSRREDVAERISELEESEKSGRRALVELEKEILRLRAKSGHGSSASPRILPKEVWELEEKEELDDRKKSNGWLSWIRWNPQVENPADDKETMNLGPNVHVEKPSSKTGSSNNAIETSSKSSSRPAGSSQRAAAATKDTSQPQNATQT